MFFPELIYVLFYDSQDEERLLSSTTLVYMFL